jgi:hypothetical protein
MAAAGSAPVVAASDPPRVARATLAATEKSLDDRFTRLWTDNPFVVLGPTRGVYLEGYGAVFTTEVNLVPGPVLGLLMPAVTKQDIERHRRMKLERIPQLKAALEQALAATAASLDTVPPDEQIVLVAFLSKYPWEDASGMPVQIMMQGSRKQLMEAQRTGAASLRAAIKAAQF